jgi:hypothetical protein
VSSILITRSKNGALAQLGERLPCTQEVSGSIPLSSTIYIKDYFRPKSEVFLIDKENLGRPQCVDTVVFFIYAA